MSAYTEVRAPWEALYRWVISDPRRLPPAVSAEVERLRDLAAFTREDVALIRDVIDYAESGKVPEPWTAERLAVHITKLAALLPPE